MVREMLRFGIALSVCCAVSTLLVGNVFAGQTTGDLVITFKYKGPPPVKKPIPIAPGCGVANVPDETLIVNPKNNGLKNVIAYIYTGRRGVNLPPQEPRNKVLKLTNAANCTFQPHILTAQVGDTVQVLNPAAVGHNANFGFFKNQAVAAMVPVKGALNVKLKQPEPAVIPVSCNIHPWMKSHLLVVDHPYFASSDDNGVLRIKDIPVGKKLVFRAWHETLTFKNKIWINGKADKWKSNKFEVDIDPGVNDLGTVEVQ